MTRHLTFMLAGDDPDTAVLKLLGPVPRPPAQPSRELERLLQLIYPQATCLIAVGPVTEIHAGENRLVGVREGEALLALDSCIRELRYSCRRCSRIRA